MKKDKFLTVYAVLDEISQKALTILQNEILKNFPNSTQTKGIPFHISLGSFPLTKKKEVLNKMRQMKKICNPSEIELVQLDHFNFQVIYAKPVKTKELLILHQVFEGNYADGHFWEPHVSLYCGKSEEGKKIISQYSFPEMKATIVGIECGEFFPPKIIGSFKF